MAQPIAINSLDPISGSVQLNNISYAIETENRDYINDYGSAIWAPEYPPQNGIVFIKQSDAAGRGPSNIPLFWTSDSTSSADIVAAANKLPGSPRNFTNTGSAYSWSLANGYFITDPNQPYQAIDTDGLVFYLDASKISSYPTTGSQWYNLSRINSSGTLANGPIFNPNGCIVFDGVDDVINLTPTISQSSWSLTSKFQFNVEKIKTSQYVYFTINTAGTRVGRSLLEFTYSSTIVSMVVDSSGNIFLGGRITETNGTRRELIVKLNNSGSVITAFDAGLYITQTQDTTGLALDATGSLFYVGYNIGNLTKLNSTTGAQFQRISGSVNASITQANVLLDEPNNKVYIGGWFTSIQGRLAQRFARLNLNTMGIDSTFDTTTGFPTEESVQTIALQSDGKVLVGGQFTSYKGSTYNRIIRLNPDASIDTTFNIGAGFNSTVQRNCIVVQPDGKIIVGGQFQTYSGSAANRIVRLNSSGSIDNTFNTGVGFNSTVYDIKLQPDGKILAVGEFTTYSGSSSSRIIRLNPDGTRDTTFNVGSGVNSAPSIMYLQNDGKILVAGGNFTSYSGSTANQVFRVTNSGSLDTSFSVGTGTLGAYRMNNQIIYRASNNVLTSQFFYSITAPAGYDWRAFETASLPLLNRFNEYTLTKNSSGVYTQYWNGQLRNNVTQSTALDTSFDVNRIGTVKGEISTFNIYGKTLNQSEINQNYYGGPIVTSGLVFAVDAGNLVSYESGSTITYSLTGSISGSLTNGVGYSNIKGGTWNFDGTNDYINFGNDPTVTLTGNSVTLEAWVNYNISQEDWKGIIYKANGNSSGYQLFIDSAERVAFGVITTSGFSRPNAGFTLPTNTWHHIVGSYDGSNLRIYVNGILYNTTPQTGNILTSTTNLYVGMSFASEEFPGYIPIARIYNRGLTTQEVLQNFNAQRQRFGI
jgi:uncharacterized delta-60 repeat protein